MSAVNLDAPEHAVCSAALHDRDEKIAALKFELNNAIRIWKDVETALADLSNAGPEEPAVRIKQLVERSIIAGALAAFEMAACTAEDFGQNGEDVVVERTGERIAEVIRMAKRGAERMLTPREIATIDDAAADAVATIVRMNDEERST